MSSGSSSMKLLDQFATAYPTMNSAMATHLEADSP